MPYRKANKPEEKQLVLLYEKPWWWLWAPGASYEVDNDSYSWKYHRRWRLKSEVFDKKNVLWYTSKGNWVLLVFTYKYDPEDSGHWRWFLFEDTLEKIESRLSSNSGWKATDESRRVALRAFKKLLKVKDGELTEKGVREI